MSMKFVIKLAAPKDEPFLWHMLYEAAHMAEAGEPIEAAQHNPALAHYVAHWGQEHDVGYIAIDPNTGQRASAAWFRLLHGVNKGYGYVSGQMPELAIGALPAYRGQGAGITLMEALIQHARGTYTGLSLSVRNSNLAVRLYERFGFQRVPGSEVANRVGGHSCTMVLNLA
jgi:ribosomal protein S18 acetylase RimI-like enzyme